MRERLPFLRHTAEGGWQASGTPRTMHTPVSAHPPKAARRRPLLLPILAVLITVAIFIVDALPSLRIAIAVMYVTVVLLSATFLRRRGVRLVTLGCMALTAIGYAMSFDGLDHSHSVLRCIVSLAAIAVTGFMALQNKAATEHLTEGKEALRRSEALLAGTQRLSRTGSISVKMPGRHMYWSDESARIYGYDPAMPPSMELMLARAHPEDMARVRQIIQAAEAGEPALNIEHRLLMPDGAVKHVRFLAHLRQTLDGKSEYLGALVDVTDVKEGEERMLRLQSEVAHANRLSTLGELAASIAHEVGQPLTVIQASSEAAARCLQATPVDLSGARDAAATVRSEVERATQVLARIRALAQNRQPRHAPLDFNEAIRESLLLLSREAGKQGCQIETRLAAGLAPVVGDRIQLQQVMINLVMNSMHAMSNVNGRPRIIRVHTETVEDGAVCAMVSDCGTGIAQEHMARLFSPFFSTRPGGMGMGLSVCRSIVTAHEGKLWASNNEGGPGATLRFVLPLRGQAGSLAA
jgi:PAS domain S-box-containing protein